MMDFVLGGFIIQGLFVVLVFPLITGIIRGIGRSFLRIKLVVKMRPFYYYLWGARRFMLVLYSAIAVLFFLCTAVLSGYLLVTGEKTAISWIFYYIPLLVLGLFGLLLCVLLGKQSDSDYFKKPENAVKNKLMKEYRRKYPENG